MESGSTRPKRGGLKGITKNLSSGFSSHVVSALQQLALTPLFLRNYGAAGYGEWLTLSASISYLATLDFGIQTYVNQDLTVRYHRGDMDGLHTQQSTALRMLLGICVVVTLLALLIWLMPVDQWLKMDGSGPGPKLSPMVVSGTVFALALMVLANIIFGFFVGQFMVLGISYIGQYWANAKNALVILVSVPCLILKTSFAVIALAQLLAVLVCIVGILITLFRMGREIFPTLRYWDGSSVGAILRPSAYFALLFSTNFLVYQVPVLILARGVGPVEVAIFGTTRTIFSMARQVLNSVTQAIGPEVTSLYAKGDWTRLSRLYDYSERIVFSLIPVVNLGTLFLGPVLAALWLHDSKLFTPGTYVLFAAISVVLSAKEHKYQFQVSTNTHRELSRFMFGSYVVLVGVWWVAVGRFGMIGIIVAWLVVEVVQMLYIMRLNTRFFAHHEELDTKYPLRLAVLCSVALVASLRVLPYTALLPLVTQIALAVGVGALLSAIVIPVFNLAPIWGTVRGRVMTKLGRAQ